MEKNKENAPEPHPSPAPASKKSLDFGKGVAEGEPISTASRLSSLKPHESNVFAGSGKRGRGSEDSDLSLIENEVPSLESTNNKDVNVTSTRKTPSAKRQRVSGASEFQPTQEVDAFGDVLTDIGNVSTFTELSQTSRYRVPLMGERKVYRRIPLDSDFVSVTMETGERFYLRY